MSLKRSFVAQMLLVCLAIPALAQAPTRTPKELVAQQYRICGAVCAKRFRTCGTSSECDTSYIGCTIACHGCVPGFGTCAAAAAPDADSKTCQTPFIACFRTALAALPTSRPLIRFGGGDGATLETSVVVLGALNEAEGINAENLWAARTHPSWRKQNQALINRASRSYDQISYASADGRHEVWFDITSFFGKP